MTNQRVNGASIFVSLRLLGLALIAVGLACWLIPNTVSSDGSAHEVDAPDSDGQVVPSTSNLFGVAGAVDLNQAGDYAFFGAGQSALFLRRANTGTTVRVVQMGDPVPTISGGQTDLLMTPRLNGSAKLAFAADYGTSTFIQRAILVFDGVSFQRIVNSSDIAPGTGGAIFGRTINLAGINDAGDIAFTGSLVPLGSAAAAQTTLFIALNSSGLVRVAGPGDPAPGTGGGTLNNISLILGANSLNNGGEVLFSAQIVGGTGGFGLFVGSALGVRKVVANGGSIPGGGTFSITSAPLASSVRFNNTGQVAFIASPSTTIWTHDSEGGIAQAVAAGDPTPLGGTFGTTLSIQAFNDSGALAFIANITGVGNTNLGLFRFRPGNPIETIGFVNQSAPGASPAQFASFSSISMNSTGLVSFRATLANGSIARAIYQQSGTSAPVDLGLEGETADQLPGGGILNFQNTSLTRTLNNGLTYGCADIIGGTADYAEFLVDPNSNATVLMSNADTLPAGSRTSQRTFRVGASGDYVAFFTQQTGGRWSVMVRNITTNITSTLATDGDVAPGTGGGKIRISNLNTAFVNGSGTIAFASQIIGGTQGVSSGIFTATPGGGITKLVAAGDLFSGSPISAPFLTQLTPSPLNATGQVVFKAQVLGLSGIYVGSAGGSIQRVAQPGADAPGGGTFSTLSTALAINSAGQVAFFATTTGGPGQNLGIFVGTPGGAAARIAVSGDSAPGGGTFAAFPNTAFSFNDSGEVAFQALLNGGAGTGAFVGSTSGLQAVALNGAPSPAGGNFSLSVNPDILINNQHDVVFRAALTGGSADSGYFLRRGANGALQTVAVQGQSAPGTLGTFPTIPSTANNFVGENFSLGPSGEVAFSNTFQVNTELINGVFRFRTDNQLEKILVRGDVVPNTGNGIFAGGFQGLGTGGPGHFALWALVVGGNVGDTIYVTSPASGFAISGRVTNVSGSGIGGVTLTLSGSSGATTTTDNSGNYSFANVAAGNYTVTPSSGSYAFDPSSQTFNNLNVDRIANFVGTQTVVSITGNVTDINNVGINNATLALTKNGVPNGTVQTDSLGNYSFSNLAVSANYVVTPTGSFTPSSQTLNNLTANATANFKAAPQVPPQCNTASFAAANNLAVASTPYAVAIGDFNADAKSDLAVANWGSNNISILLGNGTGGFSPATNFPVGTNPHSVAVGDFNNDGKLDLAVANINSFNVSILLGTGTGTFGAATNFTAALWPAYIAVGDFNTDGKSDLAVANADSANVSILIGTGTGSFAAAINFVTGNHPVGIAIGDFNADGKSDLAAANQFSDDVSILLGTGTGSFAAATNFAVGAAGPLSVATGDFNGDGRNDLAVATLSSSNVSILLGTGTGAFGAPGNLTVGLQPFSAGVGDFNGDGKSDLAVATFGANNAAVLLGTGTGTFGSPLNFPVGSAPRSVAIGDFNGDSKNDLVFPNQNSNNVSVLLNTSATCNTQSSLTISGQVKAANNSPLADVTVTLSGPISRVVQTDVSGNYSFANLVPGGDYAVTVQSPYYLTAPSRADFFNLSSNQTANFVAAPVVVPSPLPPPSDDFNSPTRDASKWTIGTQTSPPSSFDPQVTTAQVNGQLVITPLTQVAGTHYNGYVSANSFDMRNGSVGVELVKAATGGADTIFAIGTDSDNFFRFLVHTAGGPTTLAPTAKGRDGIERPLDTTVDQLIFQVKINGVLTSVSIPYDSTQHNFLRFRDEPAANSIVFETSPKVDFNPVSFTHSVVLQKGISALTVELSAGTPSATNPGQTIFDNLNLVTSTFQFSAAGYTVNEGDGTVVITVTRTGGTGSAAIGYTTADGTATQTKKYIPAIGTLSFAAGQTSRTFQVLIEDNIAAEGNQTVNLLLDTPVGSGLNSPGRAVLTIVDNDTVQATVNALNDATFFARQHYLDFLNRQPDPDGLAFWAGTITSCGSDQQCLEVKRINASAAFFLSIEFQQTGYLVERIYKTAYGDATGTSTFNGVHQLPVPIIRLNEFLGDTQQIGLGVVVGQGNWQQQLEDNKNAFTAEFVQRTRFKTAFATSLTPAQFVDKLFQNAGVTPSASDRTTAINEFSGAADSSNLTARSKALRNVAENAILTTNEFNRAFVLMQYFGYLRRNPNDPQDTDYTGYDFWLTKLNNFTQPGDVALVRVQNAEMVKAFIVSGEYRSRFAP